MARTSMLQLCWRLRCDRKHDITLRSEAHRSSLAVHDVGSLALLWYRQYWIIFPPLKQAYHDSPCPNL